MKDGGNIPQGFKGITGNWIFDVKMYFTRKSIFMAEGHLIDSPQSVTYSSVVSSETVRIMLTISALNDIDIKLFDIGNIYLNSEIDEKF